MSHFPVQFGAWSAINDKFAAHLDKTFCPPEKPIRKWSKPYPSLFPAYLPFRTQHYLLIKVQAILEQACYEFGLQKLPDTLQKRHWDCPESAELNLWAAELQQQRDDFWGKAQDVGKPLEQLFQSVADIRHTAVHRVRVSAKGIEQFILDAESLATLLDNRACLTSLTKLRRDTLIAIEELGRTKHLLHSKLEENLKRIAAQRAELDRLEKAAITEMVEEDEQYQVFAGMNLERAMASSEVATGTLGASVVDARDSEGDHAESVTNEDKPSSAADQ